MSTVLGVHHVTAIAGNPQQNVDFYVGVLGLRLVKKTINFDDPYTYHLYYGDEVGSPGTLLTFFPWTALGMKGQPGTGQLTVISFSIAANAMGFWEERLRQHHVDFKGPVSRFEEEVITFRDPDGIELELVSSDKDKRRGWKNGPLSAEHAIRGFYGVVLTLEGYERTAGLLTATLGFRAISESGSRFRYEVGAGGPGTLVDILCRPDDLPGRMGVGAVHHVAWRTSDDASQLTLRQEIARLGYNVTPVIDRNYFHSIYFREPGHVLFEIATDPPGMTVDEKLSELGMHLKLPPWLESERASIEKTLPPISLRKSK
jgi:catechol 2,3-dioxygenase-like lactoylglutathione lyase family enzyme